MSPPRPRPRPLEEAFLQTAQRLDRQWPGMEEARLSGIASLAILRRQLIESLARSANPPGDPAQPLPPAELMRWWEFCERRACPLLDGGLDHPGDVSDPRRAIELAGRLPAEPDLSQLLQDLRELKLTREQSGDLSLVRGRTARRRVGMFFTPEWMARRLVALALDPLLENGRPAPRVLDPACGSGRLLLMSLDRLVGRRAAVGKSPGELVRELAPGLLRGVDIDPLAVTLSRSFLWLRADPNLGSFPEADSIIFRGDALLANPPGEPERAESRAELSWAAVGGDFDVIVANPPFEVLKGYRRREGLREYVARLRSSGYRLALRGNLNTYRLFLERSLDLLAEGGRLAFVLPLGFLTDHTAAPLRKHLLQSGWIEQVETYPESARTFSGVGQSVALISVHKKRRKNRFLTLQDGTGKTPRFRLEIERLGVLDPGSLPIPLIRREAFELAGRMQSLNFSRLDELAIGRVGEVDQTFFRRFMRSRPAGALLLRGAHLSPFRAELGPEDTRERWLDERGFSRARGQGRWREDVGRPRLAQTGIVNLEARRRLVAAEVPPGVYLGNSLNYFVPRPVAGMSRSGLLGYLLGLLNSTPLEWRFRLTSSNNNINLYEVKALPLPRLTGRFPPGRTEQFLERAADLIGSPGRPVSDVLGEIATAEDSPARDDRAVAMLIGRVARLREGESHPPHAARLEQALDGLVSWHLGLQERDLERMREDLPARAPQEERG